MDFLRLVIHNIKKQFYRVQLSHRNVKSFQQSKRKLNNLTNTSYQRPLCYEDIPNILQLRKFLECKGFILLIYFCYILFSKLFTETLFSLLCIKIYTFV